MKESINNAAKEAKTANDKLKAVDKKASSKIRTAINKDANKTIKR